jgi:hypothetical protein
MFNPRTLPCPNCKEIINDQMQVCRYCKVPVDPAIAAQQAELQSKVNKACSDASFMRTAAAAMYVFLLLSFIPFVPAVGWAFLIAFFLVLIMGVRWQFSFGGLVTGDPDYVKAKRSKNIAFILWAVAIPVAFILRPLAYFYVLQVFNR